jgi:hypothetical protein
MTTPTYRFVETTPGGTLTIDDAETAVHIVLYGTAVGFTVAFDNATLFSARRLFRISNDSTQDVLITNFTGSITDVIMAGNVTQATLTDLNTAAGVWKFRQHVEGAYSSAGEQKTDTDLVQYPRVAGRAGGQRLAGGTGDGEDLELFSTTHINPGNVKIDKFFKVDAKGNVVLSGAVPGTSGAGVIAIPNADSEPSTSPADQIQVYAADSDDGDSTLALRTEQAVEQIGQIREDSRLMVKINGTNYYLILATLPVQ